MTWQEEAEKHPAWPYFRASILDSTCWFVSMLEDIWNVYRMGWEDHEKRNIICNQAWQKL